MSEYIDKSEAVGEGYLQDWYISSVLGDDEPVWTDAHIEELAKDFIVIPKDTPAADVAPVVHAHWKVRFDNPYRRRRCYCSNCKKHSGIGGNSQEKPYCPNCGAKMDRRNET